MTKFAIGDVVMVTAIDINSSASINFTMRGKCGIVRCVDGERYGVEFNESFLSSHNMGGVISTNRGWYIYPAQLVKMFPVKDVIKSHFELTDAQSHDKV